MGSEPFYHSISRDVFSDLPSIWPFAFYRMENRELHLRPLDDCVNFLSLLGSLANGLSQNDATTVFSFNVMKIEESYEKFAESHKEIPKS